MIAKWIVCTVPEKMRNDFSIAQQGWSEISRLHGFVTQVGGWDSDDRSRACVLGLWQNQMSYDSFMANQHDPIVASTRQDETYDECRTGVFETVFEVECVSRKFVEALKTAAVLRVVCCELHGSKSNHFISIQRDLWEPGMRNAGMLAGFFSRSSANQDEYIVVSVWRDSESHDSYIKDHFPKIQKAAQVENDFANLDSAVVLLDNRWKVIANSFP